MRKYKGKKNTLGYVGMKRPKKPQNQQRSLMIQLQELNEKYWRNIGHYKVKQSIEQDISK